MSIPFKEKSSTTGCPRDLAEPKARKHILKKKIKLIRFCCANSGTPISAHCCIHMAKKLFKRQKLGWFGWRAIKTTFTGNTLHGSDSF